MGYIKSRWQEMDRGRRVILVLQPAMFLLFLTVWLAYGRQPVVEYMGAVLRAETQGQAAVYSGRVNGWEVRYEVSPGPVVEFWLDGELDSTYTVAEDPTAIPDTEEPPLYAAPDAFTGVEIRKDGQVWFRGAWKNSWPYMVWSEDGGTSFSYGVAAFTTGTRPEPDAGDILSFAGGPETTPRGYGPGLLYGLLISAICLVSLLFEDQLFRWHLSFRIQDPDRAEPSEWEMMDRWISWIVLTGCALVIYALASGLIHAS